MEFSYGSKFNKMLTRNSLSTLEKGGWALRTKIFSLNWGNMKFSFHPSRGFLTPSIKLWQTNHRRKRHTKYLNFRRIQKIHVTLWIEFSPISFMPQLPPSNLCELMNSSSMVFDKFHLFHIFLKGTPSHLTCEWSRNLCLNFLSQGYTQHKSNMHKTLTFTRFLTH